jgi:hypothetical protein
VRARVARWKKGEARPPPPPLVREGLTHAASADRLRPAAITARRCGLRACWGGCMTRPRPPPPLPLALAPVGKCARCIRTFQAGGAAGSCAGATSTTSVVRAWWRRTVAMPSLRLRHPPAAPAPPAVCAAKGLTGGSTDAKGGGGGGTMIESARRIRSSPPDGEQMQREAGSATRRNAGPVEPPFVRRGESMRFTVEWSAFEAAAAPLHTFRLFHGHAVQNVSL